MDDELHDTIRSAVSDALATAEKSYVRGLFYLFGVFVLFTIVPDYLSTRPWVNKLIYSIKFSVDSSQVIQTVGGPPSDCDFLKSPIDIKC
jgi:hypothetical protein